LRCGRFEKQVATNGGTVKFLDDNSMYLGNQAECEFGEGRCYCDAIASVQQAMNSYDPAVIGYSWDDSNPRIQLEPRGNRGYIEMRAIKSCT